MNKRPFYIACLVLVIVGAINWLLIGLAGLDLVARLAGRDFGQVGGLNGAVYTIVGLAGLYLAIASWISPPVETRRSDTRPLPR
jgi:uncharacterized membrane protein YuzA (DUF378 family)